MQKGLQQERAVVVVAGFNLPPPEPHGFRFCQRNQRQRSTEQSADAGGPSSADVSGAGLCDSWGVRRLNEESATYGRNTACRGDAGPNATLVKCVSVQAGCHDQMETVDCCQNSAGACCRELIMTRPKYKLLSTVKAVSHR